MVSLRYTALLLCALFFNYAYGAQFPEQQKPIDVCMLFGTLKKNNSDADIKKVVQAFHKNGLRVSDCIESYWQEKEDVLLQEIVKKNPERRVLIDTQQAIKKGQYLKDINCADSVESDDCSYFKKVIRDAINNTITDQTVPITVELIDNVDRNPFAQVNPLTMPIHYTVNLGIKFAQKESSEHFSLAEHNATINHEIQHITHGDCFFDSLIKLANGGPLPVLRRIHEKRADTVGICDVQSAYNTYTSLQKLATILYNQSWFNAGRWLTYAVDHSAIVRKSFFYPSINKRVSLAHTVYRLYKAEEELDTQNMA